MVLFGLRLFDLTHHEVDMFIEIDDISEAKTASFPHLIKIFAAKFQYVPEELFVHISPLSFHPDTLTDIEHAFAPIFDTYEIDTRTGKFIRYGRDDYTHRSIAEEEKSQKRRQILNRLNGFEN